MTSAASVTFSLTPSGTLVLSDDGATYRLTENGIGRPGISWRLGQMPDSDSVHGTEWTSAAKDTSSLPLEFNVFAASTSALETACTAVETALSQFTYTATVAVDGSSKVWTCGPANWSSGLVDSGEVRAHQRRYVVTVPVFPIAS